MSDGITSPPYPRTTANSFGLYNRTFELRNWVVEETENLVDEIPDTVAGRLKQPEEIPAITMWENVSVADKHDTYLKMRFIREKWDQIIRQYEDAWDSNAALNARFLLIEFSISVLNDAFVDPETKEAREHKLMEQANKQMRFIQETIGRAMQHEDFFGGEGPEEEGTDDFAGS